MASLTSGHPYYVFLCRRHHTPCDMEVNHKSPISRLQDNQKFFKDFWQFKEKRGKINKFDAEIYLDLKRSKDMAHP